MKRGLLDTDTLSFYLKGAPAVVNRAREYVEQLGRLDFSIITYYEIRRGLLYAKAQQKAEQFEKMAAASCVWPLNVAESRKAAEICARLWLKGTPLDDADILIAGIALANDLVLVTNNERHFRRVEGLRLDNWLTQ